MNIVSIQKSLTYKIISVNSFFTRDAIHTGNAQQYQQIATEQPVEGSELARKQDACATPLGHHQRMRY